jgi:hypothetical protein
MTLKFGSDSYVSLAVVLAAVCIPLLFRVFIVEYTQGRCTVVTCRDVQRIAEPLKCVGQVVGIGKIVVSDVGDTQSVRFQIFVAVTCDAVSSGRYCTDISGGNCCLHHVGQGAKIFSKILGVTRVT